MQKKAQQQENTIFIVCLEQMRIKSGLTRQKLANRMGVSEATVGGWEDGERPMDLTELRQFCIAAEITIFEFIDELELVLSKSMECQGPADRSQIMGCQC